MDKIIDYKKVLEVLYGVQYTIKMSKNVNFSSYLCVKIY
ncbi:hypothetical protein R84B8_01796 [Treponema sp. R8-4-B8]